MKTSRLRLMLAVPANGMEWCDESLPQTATHRVAKFKLRGDKSLRDRAVDLMRN